MKRKNFDIYVAGSNSKMLSKDILKKLMFCMLLKDMILKVQNTFLYRLNIILLILVLEMQDLILDK